MAAITGSRRCWRSKARTRLSRPPKPLPVAFRQLQEASGCSCTGWAAFQGAGRPAGPAPEAIPAPRVGHRTCLSVFPWRVFPWMSAGATGIGDNGERRSRGGHRAGGREGSAWRQLPRGRIGSKSRSRSSRAGVRADRLLTGLAINKLLGGVRGAQPADRSSIIDAIVRLSILAHDLGDRLTALDVNPLIASPKGCMAVDALVVSRERAAGDQQAPDEDRERRDME